MASRSASRSSKQPRHPQMHDRGSGGEELAALPASFAMTYLSACAPPRAQPVADERSRAWAFGKFGQNFRKKNEKVKEERKL